MISIARLPVSLTTFDLSLFRTDFKQMKASIWRYSFRSDGIKSYSLTRMLVRHVVSLTSETTAQICALRSNETPNELSFPITGRCTLKFVHVQAIRMYHDSEVDLQALGFFDVFAE